MKNLFQPFFIILLFFSKLPVTAQVPILNSHPSASAVVFLDFDGHTVTGTSWNVSGPIYCSTSGMSNVQITEMFNRVAEDYRPFNINVTTDSSKFLSAPSTKRMRVIISISSAWYGGAAAGVAFIGSFTWGDDTPCFIFSASLSYNVKNISEAISHECGHTLGLYHQSSYDANCIKISEYNYGQGSGETGWAPIMGVGYNKNFTVWHNGPNPYGCAALQNDSAVITSTIGTNAIRKDDYSNSFNKAAKLNFQNNQFLVAGIIETNSDHDLFKFTVPSPDHLILNATPFNIGNNNAGSDLDLEITLFNNAGQLIRTYNPANLLSAVIDTNIANGTYYIRVHGSGNSNVSNYGSLGSYSLQANLSDMARTQHQLELKENLVNGKNYYSNIVAVKAVAPVVWPHLVSTIITNDCSINSPGDFTFSIYSMSGQFISKGNLDKGVKLIRVTDLAKGIYIINFSSRQGYYSEKFIKQ